jgi:hypothetical protein
MVLDKSEKRKLIFKGISLMKDVALLLMKDNATNEDKEEILEALRRYIVFLSKALMD